MAEAGKVLTAADFFGKDGDGVEKFKTVAFRALYDQKVEDELKNMRVEKDRLQEENAALTAQVKQLKQSMAVNIDDRERVLAFKSKRIEELLIKVKDYEAVNTSLLQTINGSSELTDAGRNTGASISLLQKGLPLFHAVETCKEQDYKRLLEKKKLQCEQLQRQIADNEALMAEMQAFQRQKDEWATRLQDLETLVEKTAAEKDEKIHFLERKLVFEHDRLTKEKDSEILAHQNTMEKQLRLQLDVTTQRTIEENVRVQLELRYQSSQLEKLIKQLDTLQAENRNISQEKKLVEDMNVTLSKRIKFYEQLFAKMQQKDQLKTKSQQRSEGEEPDPRSRRKPPLPCLVYSAESGTRFAFTLASPPRSPSRGEDATDQLDSPLHLDMEAVEQLGDQLNSVGYELDMHMQKREFSRKEVDAMLQFNQSSLGTPTRLTQSNIKSKRRTTLTTREFSPASYTPRGARCARDPPLTLDSFIREHVTISPRVRPPRAHVTSPSKADSRLPVLSKSSIPIRPPVPRVDTSLLWKASPIQTTPVETCASDASQDRAITQEHPLTARF